MNEPEIVTLWLLRNYQPFLKNNVVWLKAQELARSGIWSNHAGDEQFIESLNSMYITGGMRLDADGEGEYGCRTDIAAYVMTRLEDVDMESDA
jgi:hypothetical protein